MIRLKKNNPLNLPKDTLYSLYSDENIWMCFFFGNASEISNFMIEWNFDLGSEMTMMLTWRSEDRSFFFDKVVTSPDGDIGQRIPYRDRRELEVLIEYIIENQGDLEEELFVFVSYLIKKGKFTDLQNYERTGPTN